MTELETHGTYPNDYGLWNHLVEITKSQAAEFLKVDEDFELSDFGFVCFKGNSSALAIHRRGTEYWLLQSTDYELRKLLLTSFSAEKIKPYLNGCRNQFHAGNR